MGDNRDFDFKTYFEVLYLLFVEGSLLLSAHGYQLLSIATSYLVGNNKEFDV